jgi:hypothetical protein
VFYRISRVTPQSSSRHILEIIMDKKIAGLLGAAAALSAMTGTQAAPADPSLAPASSYKDLLQPVPNALAGLKAAEAALIQAGPAARLERVQYHHHHHHHHHGIYPGAVIGGVIGGLLPRPCYWTYGQPYWDGYRWVRPRVQVCR